MNNDEKILKALETLQAGQTRLEKTVETLQADMSDVKQGQTGLEKRLTAKIDNVDMKVEAFNHKLDTTAEAIKGEIKETIEREAKATSDAFTDTFEKLDKQEKLEKRMQRVEKRLDLPQL